jgi:hypothetical protein
MLTNTQYFREAALHFKKYGYYTSAPQGTFEYKQYWDIQKERCLNGYVVGDTKVTGYHYFYLNFCPILLTDIQNLSKDAGRTSGVKVEDFPAFWDLDFEYFTALDKAILEGKHMIVLKGRGKGFSYKGAAMSTRNFFLKKKSKNFVLASEKEYLTKDGFLTKCWNYMDFIDTHTAFAKRRQKIDREIHKRASYIELVNGKEIEKGYKSEIMGVSLKGDTDKARGKRGELIFFEEAGKFPGLKHAWNVARPSVEDGKITVGTLVAFGTGGEEGSDFEGLEDMFYSPEAYNALAFENIWDEGGLGTKCGYFAPAYMGATGFMDKDGNSLVPEAKEFFNKEREIIKRTAKDPAEIDRFIAENPFTPKEAMVNINSNNLPTAELLEWANYLKAHPELVNMGIAGDLVYTGNALKFKPNESNKAILKFPHNEKEDLTGSIVIYEAPFKDELGSVPTHLYVICHDPYAQNAATGKLSLGAAYVIKRPNNISQPDDIIVASYVGRPNSLDEYNTNLFKLAEYYNAKIGFENDRGEVIPFAKRTRQLNRLEYEFEMEYNSDVPKSGVRRGFGMHMTTQRKNIGELYLRDWLSTKRSKDVNGVYKLNIHTIYDPALIEELIKFNKDGNFDRAMALMIGMFHLKEVEYKALKPKVSSQSKSFFDRHDEFFSDGVINQDYEDIM